MRHVSSQVIRIYAAIAALLLASAGVWYVHHKWYDAIYQDGYRAKTAEVERDAASAAAKAQTRTVAADAGAKAVTDKGNAQVADNRQATHETVRTITQIVHDKPSPVQCVADPASLHALQSAASAANRTASELQRANTR